MTVKTWKTDNIVEARNIESYIGHQWKPDCQVKQLVLCTLVQLHAL
jgi:hypothetical protein